MDIEIYSFAVELRDLRSSKNVHARTYTHARARAHTHTHTQVRLLWLVGSVEYCTTLHSKLCSKKLPSAIRLARRIECALEGPPDAEDEVYDQVSELPLSGSFGRVQHWTNAQAAAAAAEGVVLAMDADVALAREPRGEEDQASA